MSWIKKNPFGRGEDPGKHMLALLAQEAERTGAPLSKEDQEILASGIIAIPWELDAKARNLIDQMLEMEEVAGSNRDPKSFANSLKWVDCAESSNLLELTYQVATARRANYPLSKKWGFWFKDMIGLVGCAFLVVIFLMLFARAIIFLFDHK
jgi:hypothetical protein